MQQKVASSLKKAVRRLALAGSLVGVGYGLAKYQSICSWKEFSRDVQEIRRIRAEENQENKGGDRSRDLGSGDLMFMKHQCFNSFSVSEMKKCYVHKVYKSYVSITGQSERYRQSHWDSVGVLVKDESGTRVLFWYFGHFYDYSLEEFLLLPFLSNVSVSRLITGNKLIDEDSSNFRRRIYLLNEIIEKSWPKRSEGLFRDGVDIILNYWTSIGFSNIELIKSYLRQTVGDIENSKSKILVGGFGEYSRLIPLKK